LGHSVYNNNALLPEMNEESWFRVCTRFSLVQYGGFSCVTQQPTIY